jgi:predicted nucleotidyltransferase
MNKDTIIKLIADYFKTQPVLKAYLFGSFSRGEETESSDIDILIVLDESQHIGLKFFGMYEDLKDLLGRKVDLVTERSLAPFARESVNRFLAVMNTTLRASDTKEKRKRRKL